MDGRKEASGAETFDALMRDTAQLRGSLEEEFLQFARKCQELQQSWKRATEEQQKCMERTQDAAATNRALVAQLSHMRHRVTVELERRRRVEARRDTMIHQLKLFDNMLHFQNGICEERRSTLCNEPIRNVLEDLRLNGCGSNCNRASGDFCSSISTLADLLSSISEDSSMQDVTSSSTSKSWELMESKTSGSNEEIFQPAQSAVASCAIPLPKRREQRSRRRVSVLARHSTDGEKIPHSVKKDPNIEGEFGENNNCENEAVLKSTLGNHYFIGKTVIQLENCNACMTRILIGGFALRCETCGILCHPQCKDVMPCVRKGRHASAPAYLQQNGLYITPASQRLMRTLKEEQLGVECMTSLSSISNIHVMCSLLLDYFWNLEEPMISVHHFQKFILAAEKRCCQHVDSAIDALAETNRSTLAFIMRHLQNVLQHGNIGMEVLRQVFGPVLFGNSRCYSKTDEKQCIFRTFTCHNPTVLPKNEVKSFRRLAGEHDFS
uniref:Uncharacterized protein n=1 Tax=Eptatretus burgeri TaxID=7764 RepID=A0A8C4NFR5_EPTBU